MSKLTAIAKFLQAANNLAKQGMSKDQIMEFAKREFGEVNDFFKRQIEQIFTPKSGGITSIKKPEGEVIEASFKPGMDKRGKVVDESPSQASGTSIDQEDFLSRVRRQIQEDRKTLGPIDKEKKEGIEFSIPSQGIIRQKGTADEIMNYLSTNPYRPKGPLDPNTGMTRTAARTILRRLLDEGKINIPDERERKAIAEGYQGGVDPIEVFEKVFGRENLQDLSELADEMNRAGDYTELNKILKRENLFDLKQKDKYEKDPGGMSDEELRQFLKDKGVDPDDTGFADGGRVKYRFGSGMKLAGFLAIRGKTLMDEIRKAVQNLNVSGDRKLDADIAVDDMLEELGASRDQFDQKDILDAYDKAYNMLTKEIQMTRELAPKMTERMELKAKYPGIDDELLDQIIEMDPAKKAEMFADMEMGAKLIEQGRGADEVKDIIEKGVKTRKDNAEGGLNYLMGM